MEGKLLYVRKENNSELARSFSCLCISMGTVHYCITLGNSKANGLLKWTIRTIKDAVR